MCSPTTRPNVRTFLIAVAMLASSAGCARSNRIIALQLDNEASVDASSAGEAGVSVGVSKQREVLVSTAGLTSIALGGYMNGESYQQDGIVSFGSYQYVAFWNSKRHVVLARRSLPDGTWSSIEFTDYANTQSVAEDTISVGICPGDGTIHLAFDNLPFNDDRLSEFHYRKSVVGLATATSSAAWSSTSFSSVSKGLVDGTAITQLGYPRFVAEPNGNVLFEGSINAGNYGGADEYLWEYSANAHSWTSMGRFIAGIADTVTAYTHGLSYARGGQRLHLSWCWREDTTDVSTNHDLLYVSSDDDGRTWQNGNGDLVATTGRSALTKASPGIVAWVIGQNRGLINQEHMTTDSMGRVHVLLSHLPDAQADDSNFTSARSQSEFFHYQKGATGSWTRTSMGVPVVANFRGKLAFSSTGNAYAILPDLRIAAASVASNYGDWQVIDSADSGRFFSDPLIDGARLVSGDSLSIFYPQKGSPNLWVLDYSLR